MTGSSGGSRVQAFLETLGQLPPFRGVTFRGCSADAQFVRDGQSVVSQGIVPSSRSLDVATEGRATPALYAISSLTGREITALSSRRDEAEVVFLPGTLFYLAETRGMSGEQVRLVFELPVGEGPPRLPDELVSRLAGTIETFLAERGPDPRSEFTSIPGKFAGDID